MAHDVAAGLSAVRTEIARACRDAGRDPASVTLLAIHERHGVPQVIATDRHISQGGVELESVQWDAATGTLHGVSLGPAGTSHRVFVYLPGEHPWVQEPAFFFHDYPGYTVKVMEPHIVRVQVRFDGTGRVAWEVKPSALFEKG